MKLKDWLGVVAMILLIAIVFFAHWHSNQRHEKYRKCCEQAERCK